MSDKMMWFYIIAYTLFIAFIVGAVFYMKGYTNGMNRMREIQEESECVIEYGSLPARDVPIECYKYFE